MSEPTKRVNISRYMVRLKHLHGDCPVCVFRDHGGGNIEFHSDIRAVLLRSLNYFNEKNGPLVLDIIDMACPSVNIELDYHKSFHSFSGISLKVDGELMGKTSDNGSGVIEWQDLEELLLLYSEVK